MNQAAPPAREFSAIDPRQPIAVQVFGILKRSILTLHLEPGASLSEKELSLKLGVSRTPVREALIKLADEGLVDVFPQRGTVVSPIRVAEVIEAQFIREALETAVVRRAASAPVVGALVARLEENLRLQRAAIADKAYETFMQLDENFHYAIADSVSLPRAWRLIQNVKGQLDRIRYLALPEPGHLQRICDQHEAVLEALAAREPQLAASRMQTHLNEVFKSIDLLIRQKPELFG
jgi:DNA-binding GntR family transcriptional regulator